jgi:hypothetical protein
LPRSIEAAAKVIRGWDQDEVGHQSLQEPAGIKQNSYASATLTSEHNRTAQYYWNNLLEGAIELLARLYCGPHLAGRSNDP